MQFNQLVESELQALISQSKLSQEVTGLILKCLVGRNTSNLEAKYYRWANLTLASCEFLTGQAGLALHGAVAMELFALAADILDDVQDQDNDQAPWRKIPDSQAITLATTVLVLSYEALAPLAGSEKYTRLIATLNRTGLTACDGQFQETFYDQKDNATFDEYLTLINNKSGSLTGCACKMGAILGGASPEIVDLLGQFGIYLGLIAQISNDLNDFVTTDEKSDFFKGKKTLPFIYLQTMLEGEKAELFNKLISLVKHDVNLFGRREKEQLQDIMLNEGASHYCLVVQEMFKQKARAMLDLFDIPNEQKGKLSELV